MYFLPSSGYSVCHAISSAAPIVSGKYPRIGTWLSRIGGLCPMLHNIKPSLNTSRFSLQTSVAPRNSIQRQFSSGIEKGKPFSIWQLAAAPASLRGDKEFMLRAVALYGRALQWASAELKGDKQFMLAAVACNRYALKWIDDKEVVLAAVARNGFALEYASDALKADKGFMLAAVALNGFTLGFSSDELKNDKEVVLAAVALNGFALGFASDALKADKGFILAVVAQNGLALEYASDELKNDKEVVLAAVAHDSSMLRWASKAVILRLVAQNGLVLRYASDALKADKDVVATAMAENPLALEFAPEEYQKTERQLRAPGLTLLKEQMDALTQNKPIGWQEQSAILLDKARQESPTLELQRLRDWGIIEENIDARLESMEARFLSPGLARVSAKAMIGRLLEIQRLYGDTHWVSIHAQSAESTVIPDLITALIKRSSAAKDLHPVKYLRMPQNKGEAPDIEIYKQSSTDDHDLKTREDLISADIYPYNITPGESAFYFMSANRSVMRACSDIALPIIKKFYPSLSLLQQTGFAKRIVRPINRIGPDLGNLFVFCIPKENRAKVLYQAHPFGKPCDCHSSQETHRILDQLQKGKLDQSTLCRNGHLPQLRLFAPELTKNGVKTFLFSPDPKYRREQEKHVQEIIQEMASIEKVQ